LRLQYARLQRLLGQQRVVYLTNIHRRWWTRPIGNVQLQRRRTSAVHGCKAAWLCVGSVSMARLSHHPILRHLLRNM